MSQKDVTTLAYIAGIIDGEGSISITGYQSANYAKGKHGKYYQLTVSVGMQNRSALDVMAETFHGSFAVRQDTIYKIGYSSRKAAAVIRELLPYLRVKKPQAELALLFQSLRKQSGRAYTLEERASDESFRQLMSDLNRRDAQDFYDKNRVNSVKVPLRYRKDNAERSSSGTTPEQVIAEAVVESQRQQILFFVEGEENV